MNNAQRAKGMLWGLVVGDCLGSPIQFSDKDDHPHITEMEPCPVFGLPPGYWTDDSSMAFCVMDSFIEKGGYDLKDIANNFVRWYEHGFWSSVEGSSFDVGCATANACHAIRRGSLVNGSEESQGNGSIMRFAPSYLIGKYVAERGGVGTRRPTPVGSDSQADRKVMYEISDLTHASGRVHAVVDKMAKVLDDHLSGARTGETSAYATRDEVNVSGWAVSTLEAALWAFHSTSTFEEGMIAAVNLGGDSDSIGAVFGQIAGAFYGFDAIPKRWIRKVKSPADIENEINCFLTRVLTPT